MKRGPRSVAAFDDSYLPLRELSIYSGLSVRTLRGYLSHISRPLPHYRVGGKVLVKRSEFDQWAETFRVTARPDMSMDAIVDDMIAGLRV